MNKRIMKKKFNKWETNRVYNITVSFEDVPFIFIAWQSQHRIIDFQTFATSKNAMRAVKSYCKKNVWKTGKCDNIKDMYRFMCEEIHNEREYKKRIEEQKRMILDQISVDDVIEASEAWEQKERSFNQFI